MAIYKDIINQIGKNLSEYNVGTWALFRDQMATEVNSQYLFLNNTKADETLLGYSVPMIKEYNDIIRGRKKLDGSSRFTYYTENDPQTKIDGKPVLSDPNGRLWNVTSDYKPKIDESTIDRKGGLIINKEYTEYNKFRGGDVVDVLDKVIYQGDVTKYKNNQTLLSKTQNWFNDGSKNYISRRFATLISRFHTDEGQINNNEINKSVALQAGSDSGLSHGRNLLKAKGIGKDAQKTTTIEPHGYDDPYCRVWTWHKQYARLVKDTMRPFVNDDGKPISQEELNSDTYQWKSFRSDAIDGFEDGGIRLGTYGAMYDGHGKTNGLVNITPSMDADAINYSDEKNITLKNCMFSIENLAWKGTYSDWDDVTEKYGLSREQKGPLGGRIMWFPPYDLRFSEDTNANWQTNDFIGRGEPIYTYANTTRGGSLSFKLLIDHPSILDYWDRRYEGSNIENSGVDDVNSKEQELLRFFAGCSVLKSSYKPDDQYIENGDDKVKIRNGVLKTGNNTIQFMVFYPNNYSGVDDNIGGIVDPVAYLMNGVGAQKVTNNKTDDIKFGDIYDLNTNANTIYTYNGSQVGGYEMFDTGVGVSIIDSATTTNAICEIGVSGDTNTYRLAKMIYPQAPIKSTQPTQQNIKKWNLCRYYYRCDNSELNDEFVASGDNGAASYIDKRSHGLNLTVKSDVMNKFGVNDTSHSYSMAEVFVAVINDNNKCKAVSNRIGNGRIKELNEILNGKKGKILKIHTTGGASIHGNNASQEVNNKQNLKLAQNRAKTINNWLKKNLKLNDSQFAEIEVYVDDNKEYQYKESSDYEAKLNRFALVEIEYEASEVIDADKTGLQPGINSSNTKSENKPSAYVSPNKTNDERQMVDRSGWTTARYDNEARFFTKLKENDPFMAKLISERIKNFDPVFHSMSPEGFNARLTFLNQCMRQGPTISWSDTKNKFNPNNLSFGRPPVCVLRLGDFYNTKIIITSLNINYDPLLWDLNQEGIGVMPMIANITLRFNFIGGSDLAGPIQRLQNATSFNYYANTGVYDNRSDMIEYKNGEYVKYKSNPTQT